VSIKGQCNVKEAVVTRVAQGGAMMSPSEVSSMLSARVDTVAASANRAKLAQTGLQRATVRQAAVGTTSVVGNGGVPQATSEAMSDNNV
jgi:hypothetical protein